MDAPTQPTMLATRPGPILRLGRLMIYLGVVFTAPLVGAWGSGRPINRYLEFPPVPTGRVPADFSWPVCGLVLMVIGLSVAPFVVTVLRSASGYSPTSTRGRFPAWGYWGVAWLAVAWVLAWTRFDWFAALQEFTFTPLWLGYIVTVSALSYQRTGRCMLTHRLRLFLVLFPVSAAFWWSFEYLNRFVENWYYIGVSDFEPWRYFVFATLAFATVLPAVLSTAEWLATFPRVSAGLHDWLRLPIPRSVSFARSLIIVSTALLLTLGIWPDAYYPAVWIAPLGLVFGLHLIHGEPVQLRDVAHGDWQRVWCQALACLICGGFWEMWNTLSLAHWEYSVPYVQRFEIFEMPLLGYAGYLPFGLLCAAFVCYVMGDDAAT
ncbi:MAG: hypothetical protein OEQ39_12415 [Gammaproteobacteria bacterium]|nr:hypothetical protein [Gammaproteobacteria bacterium]MDH3467686.1 hypothetical protein [Gammaproteobacteria bacterium]